MKKNPSPGYIAILGASVSALTSGALVHLFSGSILNGLLSVLVTLVICTLTFYYLLQNFIYRKIKVIYKTIHRLKASSISIDKILRKPSFDIIGEVSSDVYGWAKENRKEIEQLKSQEIFRREFIGNVSHELKTPIFSAQGYIHTLLDGALEDKKVNKLFLEKASKSIERLSNLVEDLTKITELQSGKVSLDISRFSIKDLFIEAIDLLEDQFVQKATKFSFKKGNSKNLIVEADRQKILQVITNLLINALKYGRQDGHIAIGFYDLDKNLLIEVSDDGDGIAQEHLSRLFERFYRTDKGRSRNDGGSGLGLAIVKHIIELHHQTINVRSKVGSGSTFGFTLKSV